MAEETDKNFRGRTKKEAVLWWIYLLVGSVASVVIASMGYILYVANHMVAVYAPLRCAAMEIRTETTTAHLWFEEIIAGDRQESIDAVWGHLDEADWYAQAMLEGCENLQVKYYPLDDAGVRREVEGIQAKLAEFRTITQERFSAPADSRVGSEIDRRYDAVFAELVSSTEQVETEVEQMISRHLRNFHIVQTVLIFICAVLTLFVGIVVGRFMRRQIRDELKLQAANQQLDASNQQLRAGEQQLKAANQQLKSSEQQLRAANQQLRANEQQLRASNQQLRDSEERFRDFFENATIGFHIFGPDRIIARINEAELEMIGYKRDEIVGKKTWADLIISKQRTEFEKHWQDLITKGEVRNLEYTLIHKDGHQIDVMLNASSRFDEQGNLTNTRGSVLDITQRKQAEEALREARRSLLRAQEIANIGNWSWEEDRDTGFFSETIYHMLGYTSDEIQPNFEWLLGIMHPDDREQVVKDIKEAMRIGKSYSGVYRLTRKDRKEIIVDSRAEVVFNQAGEATGMIGVIQDITELKRAEQQLKASLEEKEVLLREIHHRVKNNLQIISSLLSLQSDYMQDKQAAELFRESQLRVRSMALLHERLYETEDLSHISFEQYIRDLTDELFGSYGADAKKIHMKIHVEDVSLSINAAVPCALIINELVSNSIKHAFPEDGKGQIRIRFDSDERGSCTLLISDDGVGFGKDVDFPNGRSLGLQLVCTLVEQLKGSIVLDRGTGTRFKISFPTKPNRS